MLGPDAVMICGVKRLLLAVPVALALAACGSEDSPVIDVPTTTAPPGTLGPTIPPVQGDPGTTLSLALTGGAEAPGPGSDGSATATLTYDGDNLCLSGTTNDVGALVAGHVHAGAAGESGPVVIDLNITTEGDGPFEGCATVGAEGGAVFGDPSGYYVNLHTAEFPDGAVRAQLG